MKTILAIAATLSVLGLALAVNAHAANAGGSGPPAYVVAQPAREEIVAARNPRMAARLQRTDRAKRFGLVSAVAIGADAAVWAVFAGVAASKTPRQPSLEGCPDEIEHCDEMTHGEWRRETNRVWILWGGVNALASIFPRAIASYFIARTSHLWRPSFGAMLFGSALGSAAAGGVMMGFWASDSQSPALGIISLGLVPLALPALIEAIFYAASAKPTSSRSTPVGVRHTAIYAPLVPTVVVGARGPVFGVSLGILVW